MQDEDNSAATRELLAACARGDVERVRALLAAGAPVDADDEEGKTVLYSAAERGDLRLMELLLHHGADLHAVPEGEDSMLFVAAAGGGAAAVRLLLDRGHPVDVTDDGGCTVLFRAVQSNDVGLIRVLLDGGIDVHAVASDGRSALHDGAYNGSVQALTLLLEEGTAVDALNEDGESAFQYAAMGGEVDAMRVLIDQGADPHALAADGRSALHCAAQSGNAEAVAFLLEKGLSVHVFTENGASVLNYAATGGNVDIMAQFIEHGVDIHSTETDGRTVLHSAARCGIVEACEFLLNQGLPVDAVDHEGATVFHYASLADEVDAMRLLIQHGADIHATLKDGRTALHYAVGGNVFGGVKFLLEQGVSVDALDANGFSAFHYAVMVDDVGIMKLLIDHGADAFATTKDGRTALHHAIEDKVLNAAEFLLEKGLPVDALDSDDASAFHYAAVESDVSAMRLLVDHGADAHTAAKDGTTALHYAARDQALDAVVFLLEQNLSVDAVDANDASPFHFAAQGGDIDIMKLLIERGADVFATTKRQETALHYAAFGCNADALEMLLQLGLAIDSAEEDGSTVLHNAVIQGNVGAVRLLIDRGANVHAHTANGRSALHISAAHGTTEAAKVLFDHSVDVNETDEDGETPLHKAASNGHVGTMKLLVAHGADAHAQTSALRNILQLAVEEAHADAVAYALELGVDPNARIEIGGALQSPLLVAFNLKAHEAACEIAFALCSAGATFDDKDRRTVLATSGSTSRSAGKDRDANAPSKSALWRSGLYACVDRWMQERSVDATSLTSIPFEVVARGEGSVRTYLDDVEQSSSQDRLHRCKVCVVGPSEWGKTSLVQSLKANSTFLTQLKDRTVGIDLTTCELESVVNEASVRLEVTFWDFAGQDVYHAAHTLFFSQRTLFVLVVDLEAYWKELKNAESKPTRVTEAQMNRFVGAKIFRWVRSIFAHRPDAQFVVVGSKVNRLEDPDVVAEIWDDLRDRLYHWKVAFAKGFDRELLPARANANDFTALQSKLTQLGSSDWLVADIMQVESIGDFRNAVQTTITSSELGFPMWKTYTNVLQSVVRRREEARDATSAGERIGKSIVRFSNLRRRLIRENDGLDREACEQILRTLNDLGEVLWYEHDGAGVFKDCIILDPMLIIEIVREVIRHDFSSDTDGKPPGDGRITHSLLCTFPLWKDMDVELMHAFKSLLQHFQLAYPADADEMLPESDIIVPAYWSADHSAISRAASKPKLVAPQKSLCDAFSLHRWCWEYEIPSELSETVFVQFAVQSHSSYLPRSIRGFCVEAGCAEFATSISLIQRDSPRDVLRIEVSGVSADLSWHNMQFYLMKMEKVLADYTGDVVWRSIVYRSVEGKSESRHPVGQLMKALEDAIIMGRGKDVVRETMPWMPPDMDWFMRKAWNDITSLQQLRMNHLIEEKLEVLRKLAIVGDVPRQFPALWSLDYDPTAQKALLRISSDLSGRCYHVPLEIDTGSAILGRHASLLKAGVSLFATVMGNAISLPIIQTALGAAKSAFSNNADHAERVHNLIDKLDLPSGRFDTRTTSKMSPGASIMLLRDLLKAYDDSLDALQISDLSNLECAVTANGEYVWAHAHEIATMEGKITRCSAPPSAWKELDLPETKSANSIVSSPTSSSSTTVSSPESRISSSQHSFKTGFKFSVSVNSVVGLLDWDWHKTYCKWQLYFGRKSLTPLAVDITPTNGDSSCAPSWSTMRATIESVASVEMLRECRLAVQVKRRSRIGWTKFIGEGEVWLRDFVDEDASQNFSCEPVHVPLGATTDRTVILHLALEQ